MTGARRQPLTRQLNQDGRIGSCIIGIDFSLAQPFAQRRARGRAEAQRARWTEAEPAYQ